MNGFRNPRLQIARLAPLALPKKWVVAGYAAVRVEAEHLAQAVGKRLGVVAIRVLADRDVQLAVWSEMHRAAVVVGGSAQVVEVHQHDLAAGRGDVAVGGEAADAVVNRRGSRRVVHVHEAIRREIRIERDAQKAALSARIDGDGQERGRQQRAILDDTQLPALLAHEQAAIRSERHRGRIRQPGDERLVREAARHGRGLLYFADFLRAAIAARATSERENRGDQNQPQ